MKIFKRYALVVGMLAVACSAYAQKPPGDGSVTPTTDTGAAMGGSATGGVGMGNNDASATGGMPAKGDSSVGQTTPKHVKPAPGKAMTARHRKPVANSSDTSGTSGTQGDNATSRASQPGAVPDGDAAKGMTPGGVGASGEGAGLTAPMRSGSSNSVDGASPKATMPNPK